MAAFNRWVTKMNRLITLLFFSFFTAMHAGDVLSPPLRLLCESSDLVVVASIETPPVGMDGSSPIVPTRQVYYLESISCRIRIEKILKGSSTTPPLQPVSIHVPMTADAKDPERLTLLMKTFSKESRWIMFLKRRTAGEKPNDFIAFDPWLSCQAYSRSLEIELEKTTRQTQPNGGA